MKVDFRAYTGTRIVRRFDDDRAGWEWAWRRYLLKNFLLAVVKAGDDLLFD